MYDFIKILMVGAISLLLVNISCVLFGAVALVLAQVQVGGTLSDKTIGIIIGIMAANAICGIVIFAFLKRVWRIR